MRRDISENKIEEIEIDEQIILDIGHRLKDLIAKSPYTQEKVAVMCGITYPTLLSYIKGTSYLRLDVLFKVCKILGVTPAYLLCQEDNAIMPAEIIMEQTHLSAVSSDKLINMASNYTTSLEEKYNIMCLDILIKETSLLSKIRDYFLYFMNRDVAWTNAIDAEQCFLLDEKFEYFKKLKIEYAEHVFLHEVLRELEQTAHQKYLNSNSKRKKRR